MLQRGVLGGLQANVTGGVHGSGGLHIGLAGEHLAGIRLHLILQLTLAGHLELHLIVGGILVQLRIHVRVGDVRRGQARILGRRLQSRLHADGHPRRTGLDQVPQLLHGQLGQPLEGQAAVQGHGLADQGRLAGGDVVGLGLLFQLLVLLHRLAQHGGPGITGRQSAVHGAGQLLLKTLSPGLVLILHGDEDGGGQTVQIPAPHQAAHDGVHRHVRLDALQVPASVHILQHGLGLLVQGLAGYHLFPAVHPQLDAGIHVQGHHRGHGVGLLHQQTAAAQQQHRQAGRHRLHPFLHSVILLFHRDYRSFPLCTAGEHAVHVVRRGLVQRGGKPAFHLIVGHRASSPSM